MSTLAVASFRSDENQNENTIPQNYKERGLWFERKYGSTLRAHVQNLCRFCDHLPKDQAISYSSLTEDGFVHAHYGKFSILFPIEELESKPSILHWMNGYSIEIDNAPVELDSGIQEVQSAVRRQTAERLESRGERLVNKLLPPPITSGRSQWTSKNTPIKRSIRLRKK